MTELQGTSTAAFDGVRTGFAVNFDEGDLGASCAVVHRGVPVVDLWAGHRDVAAALPWERDTIVNVWSTTKMMTALCVLMLHDRGQLSVDEPVADFWPEFAAAGKERVLVRHVLSHTAGVAGFDEPIVGDELYDWDLCCSRLAAQPPWWEPGTVSGYHASTQSWLLGELVRRVDGRTLGTFFREEVAVPLEADFHIGLADAEHGRVAEMDTAGAEAVGDQADDIPSRVAQGEPDHVALVNTPAWRRAELGASNGHGNAAAVARVLSVMAEGGELDGVRLLSPATIERIFEVQSHGVDLVIGNEAKFGIGYGLHCPGMPVGANDRTFFWAGWGGSMAVVDVENRMVVVYVMNKMLSDVVGGMRAIRVIFAAHAAVKELAGK